MSEKKRVFGYVRVSTETQVLDGEGLDIQKKKLRNYAERNDLEIVDIVEDAGISGTVELENRPALYSLMDLCKDNKVDTILIYRYDRLARDLPVQLYAENQFLKVGIEFISVSEGNLNGADPMRVAFRQMLGVFAQLDKSLTVNRMADGRRSRVSKGYRAGGALPFGYQYSEDGKSVEVVPERAVIVREMFALSPRWRGEDLAAKLNSKGYKAFRGGKWGGKSVENILNNPFYIGKIRLMDGTIIDGKHEPIITMKEWEDAR